MQDISRCRHFNSFKNENSLSLFYCHFLFETLSTYIPVVRVLRMASFSGSGISMPGTGCECQNPYITRLQEDVDRLWKEKIFLQVKFWWTGHLTQYLLMLAKFYLSKNIKESLKGLTESTGTFQIALGGDGCPFGKNESACSFLVSFLNVGRGVASSYDNFLIFGANCYESCSVTKKYVRSLLPQIAELERGEYEFECINCRFKLEELPNDMKMLAMLAG